MDRPLSRYECKYLVPEAWAPEIRRAIGPFVRPDRFAAQTGGTYAISSLYLDSSDFRMLRMAQEGWSERMKLRARTYSERPEDPVFLEVKRRFDGIVHKTRARVEREAAAAVLRSRSWIALTRSGATLARSGGSELRAFADLAVRFSARPVRHVRYQREAYEARSGEPVRVTLDRELEHADARDGELLSGGAGWRPFGPEGVVLELKFTGAFPTWMGALVARFELDRRSISKYALAEEAARADYTIPAPETRVSPGARCST